MAGLLRHLRLRAAAPALPEEPLVVGSHTIPVTRFAAPEFTPNPHRYLRGILLGRFARINQLLGPQDERRVALDDGRRQRAVVGRLFHGVEAVVQKAGDGAGFGCES